MLTCYSVAMFGSCHGDKPQGSQIKTKALKYVTFLIQGLNINKIVMY